MVREKTIKRDRFVNNTGQTSAHVVEDQLRSEGFTINGDLLSVKDPKNSTLSSRVSSSLGLRPMRDDSFPQFPNLQDDNMSTIDDTVSLATNVSEDDQQWNNASALDSPNDDDIFKSNDEVAVAEEAETLDLAQQISSDHKKFLSRKVNVLQAFLSNTNIYISVVDGEARVSGYASRCTVAELLDVVCSNVYSSLSKTTPPQSNTGDGNCDSANVHFEVRTAKDKSVPVKIRINLKDLNLDLTDEILAHLGPFVEFDDDSDQSPHLTIAVCSSVLSIQVPKKKQPLRIKLNDVEICQFDEGTDEDM